MRDISRANAVFVCLFSKWIEKVRDIPLKHFLLDKSERPASDPGKQEPLSSSLLPRVHWWVVALLPVYGLLPLQYTLSTPKSLSERGRTLALFQKSQAQVTVWGTVWEKEAEITLSNLRMEPSRLVLALHQVRQGGGAQASQYQEIWWCPPFCDQRELQMSVLSAYAPVRDVPKEITGTSARSAPALEENYSFLLLMSLKPE